MAMAAASASISNPSYSSHKHPKSFFTKTITPNLKMPTTCLTKFPNQTLTYTRPTPLRAASTTPSETTNAATFHGLCYVIGDNIDTDQIIPAEYLTLVPSKPDEYRKLGTYALIGLPSTYSTRFIDPGEFESKYSIVIGGENFGCGSSREHAPVAWSEGGGGGVVRQDLL